MRLSTQNNLTFVTFVPRQVRSKRNRIELLGRVGDVVDFVDLPTAVQVDSLAAYFGADGNAGSSFGTESCGSPGEVSSAAAR